MYFSFNVDNADVYLSSSRTKEALREQTNPLTHICMLCRVASLGASNAIRASK